jgi:predicted ABC-type ATPase
MPNLYIIAGPNGAGKTTFAQEFLPKHAKCDQFVNADLIAKGLSPFSPESVAFRAGRLVLEQIHALAKKRCDFGFETTLSGRTYFPMLYDLKAQGYSLHLFYLWVPDLKIALDRIAERVRKGGHDVSEKIVRRRYDKGVRNFFKVYQSLLDSWVIFDNSSAEPRLIAIEKAGILQVADSAMFQQMSKF